MRAGLKGEEFYRESVELLLQTSPEVIRDVRRSLTAVVNLTLVLEGMARLWEPGRVEGWYEEER